MREHYDVAIVGGGVIGTALLYVLSNFSNIKKIAIFEKRNDFGLVSSNSRSNSQTLHVGDIETNYSIEKVLETRVGSEMIIKYTNNLASSERKRIIYPTSKMVLGVGDEEVEAIENKYDEKFLALFPHIRKIYKDEIGRVEPFVLKKRDPQERIIAAHSKQGYMIDFGMLTKSFVNGASRQKDKMIKLHLNERVQSVEPRNGFYDVVTDRANYGADFVVFAAGSYSLYFAKKLGYAKDLSILAVGGNFYYSKRVLNGKVYRVQKGGIPFAAVHGDPDLRYPGRTRFGPTVNIVPFLEKSDPSTTYDYIKAFGLDIDTIASLLKVTANRDIIEIMAKNLIYSVPDLGKYFFLKEEVNKMVPSLKYNDITFEKNGGGIRPQILDKKRNKLVLGVVELKVEGLEFDMDPSPGASSCLKEALEDSIRITKYLDKAFYRERFSNIFCRDLETRRRLVESLQIPASYKREWVA